jgi:proline dehydrogenase
MSLMRSLLLALSRSERLRKTMIRFGPANSMARRFVAGETVDQAIATVLTINNQGLLATLDHLGENTSSELEARDATIKILELIDAINASGAQSGVSIKLSQLGLDLSHVLAAENLERIVVHAAKANRFVRVDMESFDYVQPTLDLVLKVREHYPNVGTVIQSYLYRSADDVSRLVASGTSIRLVKGAYNEPPEVAYPNKADTDANFVRLMEQLFGETAQKTGTYPAIATHDTKLIDRTKEHIHRHGISADRFEFQMLYGIRTGLQNQLISEGYRVRAYVPYGQQWYPYFMRRLAERPANLFFLLRNLMKA